MSLFRAGTTVERGKGGLQKTHCIPTSTFAYSKFSLSSFDLQLFATRHYGNPGFLS